MKAYPRFKVTKDNNIVAVVVSCRYDFTVTIEDFKKLVELDLITMKSQELDLVVDSLEENPFKDNPFGNNKYSTVQEVADGIAKRAKEIEDDKIDTRFDWGDHIPIVCNKCGIRYHTKNITRIGQRSIFLEDYLGTECSCAFTELRILNDSEYEEHIKAEEEKRTAQQTHKL